MGSETYTVGGEALVKSLVMEETNFGVGTGGTAGSSSWDQHAV